MVIQNNQNILQFPPNFHHHQQQQLLQNDLQPTTTSLYSFPFLGSGVGGLQVLCPQSLAYVENYFRPLIQKDVERKVQAHFNISCPSCSNSITNTKDHDSEDRRAIAVVGGGSRKENQLKLRFINKIPSTIFTTNDIEAENGEEVQVELFDVANNTIVDAAHPLSSVWIEVVVLDGEFDDEKAITHSNFNKSVVSQRLGERPLLVGDGQRFRLKNGVSSITNLSFTKNSSRTRTKNIRLGLRSIHDSTNNNNNYPTIQLHAVSNPFRVKDHRGQMNKKHHPPRGEDEVWRLEGIARNGEYHKRLSSEGILTVDCFVKAHQKDYRSLRKLLGNRVSDKKWKTMVDHAFEYVPIIIPTFDHPPTTFVEQNVVENEGMEGVEVGNKDSATSNNVGACAEGFQEQTTFFVDFQDFYDNRIFQDNYPTQTLLSHGEASTSNGYNHHVENTSTYNQYFQGATWNMLVPKPK